MFDKRVFSLPKINKFLSKLVALTVLQAFAIIVQSISIASLVTLFWKGAKSSQQIIWWMIAFLVFGVIKHYSTYAKEVAAEQYASVTAGDVKQKLSKKFTSYGDETVLSFGSGHANSLLNIGIDNIRSYFQIIFIKVMDLSIIPWIVLAYIFYLKWSMAVFLLFIYPVLIIFFVFLGWAAQSKADKEFANFTSLNNEFADALNGLQTLKQLGLSKEFSKSIYETSEKYRKSTMSTLRIGITSTFSLDFFSTLSIAVVAVFLGMDLMNGRIDLLPALTILVMTPEYFLPLRNFADDYHATLDGKNAFVQINDVLDQKAPTVNKKKISNFNEITINHLDFSYEPETGVKNLRDVNLVVEKSQKIGLVGLSGSGKTTMLNILAGLLKPTADITVGGVQLENFNNQDWRNQIIYIPQKSFLFAGTIKDNILVANPNLSDTQIRKALKDAELDLDIHFELSENAENISGGQAQRIAIARAFAQKERKIVLLDEPTAHLDLQTEMEIKKTLEKLFVGKTVFFATHRLHWLNQFDQVLVFKDGKVVEQGKTRSLKAKKDSYINKLIKGAE